jgi:hypothetical protein
VNFVGGGGIFDAVGFAPYGMLEEEADTDRGRGSFEGVATARTLGVLGREDSLKIDLALLGVELGMGWIEMGASNAADDTTEFLEDDANSRESREALWLALGDGSRESCDAEAEGGV